MERIGSEQIIFERWPPEGIEGKSAQRGETDVRGKSVFAESLLLMVAAHLLGSIPAAHLATRWLRG